MAERAAVKRAVKEAMKAERIKVQRRSLEERTRYVARRIEEMDLPDIAKAELIGYVRLLIDDYNY